MQLINSKNRKLASMTISSGIIASSFAFSYNTLDHIAVNDVISSPTTESFVQQTQENTYTRFNLKMKFDKALVAWKNNIMFLSFSEQIVKDPNFIKIVSMGEEAVPLIVEEISVTPSPLVWALNFIYDKTISNNANTTIEEACKLWVTAIQ